LCHAAACATDRERLDKFNGLLLTPNLNRLVDCFLISFNDDGTVLVSKHLGAGEWASLGVGERSSSDFCHRSPRSGDGVRATAHSEEA